MNWDAVIGISEVIGVIAIIASLVYVGTQIRQNNLIARATIIHDTGAVSMRIAELVAQDAELAAIYQKGTHGESLTGTDLVRFLALVDMYLTWLEDVDCQFEADLYFQEDGLEDIVDAQSGDLAEFFSTPEARQSWKNELKHIYRPSFVNKIDKYIDKI